MRRPASIFLLLLAACGSPITLDEDSGDSSSGPQGDGGSGTVPPGSTGTPPGSTGGPTSVGDVTTDPTAADTGETGDSSDTDGPPVCVPRRVDWASWISTTDEQRKGDNGTLEVDAECEVISADPSEGDFQLDCPAADGSSRTHTLAVWRSDGMAVDLRVGQLVHFRLRKNFPIDYGGYSYLAVHASDGALVMGAYHRPLPYSFDDDPIAWLGLQAELINDVCASIPPPPDDGRNFIVEPCPATETPLAVRFTAGDEQAIIYDRSMGTLADLEVFVSSAVHVVPEDPDFCGDPRDVLYFTVFG